MAVLQMVRGLNPGQLFPLEKDKAILGRHPDCQIVLDAGAVSRQHAQILQVGEDYFVEDLRSRNGTFVNGQLVEGRHKLNDNDKLKICDLLLSFHLTEPLPQSASTISQPAPTDSALAMVVDDSGKTFSSTIMSKVDIPSSRSGMHISVNPETKLKALLEITRNLSTAISMEQVLPKILDSLFTIFLQADRGFVVLQETEGGPLIPKAIKHRRGDEEMIRISRTIVNQVLTSKQAVLSADAASDSRFDSSQSLADFRIRSMMCAPLVGNEGRAFGVIQIDTMDQRSRFRQDDLDVLASVACQAAAAVENAQLHEQALKNRDLQRDLELAHKVQQGFLPSAPPQVAGYDFFDFYEAANQVGGDYFDYVPLPGNRLAVVLADVSGKGAAAALLMAKLSADARYSLVSEPTAAQAINRLNASFSRSGWEDRFVTLVLAMLDLDNNTVTIVNAGHMDPLLRHSNGKVEPIGMLEGGMPLGVDAECVYEQFTIPLNSGESITVFTDGFSEAMNSKGELYGIERLQQRLAANVPNVAGLGPLILDDVKKFVGKWKQSDDMCLICFGRQ